MTGREMTEWLAYEQVYGSIVPHERIDAGFAQIGYLLVRLLGKDSGRYKPRDFMPDWYRNLTATSDLERGWAALAALAKGNDADD